MVKIVLNSDTELVNEIIAALKVNGGYCPCAIEKTENTKCQCLDFQNLQEGTCHCGLFTKVLQ